MRDYFLKELHWWKRISEHPCKEAINSLLAVPFLYDMSKIREKGPGHTFLPERWGNFNNHNITGQEKNPELYKCDIVGHAADFCWHITGRSGCRTGSMERVHTVLHTTDMVTTNLVEKSSNLSYRWCDRFDRQRTLSHECALIGSSWNSHRHHHTPK